MTGILRSLTLPLAVLVIACGLILGPGSPVAAAAPCTLEDFAKAVDDAGRQLREFNAQNAPKLQAKLRQLKEKKGWGDADYEEKAVEHINDPRLTALDAQANFLLTRIDILGREDKPGDCAKLDELKAAGVELLVTMKTKSQLMFARLDSELGIAPAPKQPPAKGPPVAKAPAPPKAEPGKVEAPKSEASKSEARRQEPPADSTSSWSADTRMAPSAGVAPPQIATGPNVPPPDAYSPPPPLEEDGYTVDEIREATRGFFGTISTGLASVIEHAFRKSGRPSAYVLGTEGGGAFLAGVRYGKGTLYMRAGGTSKVYWHGPTLGYDIGAEGSRTMFLIYRLHEPGQVFRSFTGVDGSAYLVGGIGITFLKGGDVLMAPIRSGVGLRLGANIGYVRFTSEPSWNPF